MYNHQGSQRRPSDATPWSDNQETRARESQGAYGLTPGRPGPGPQNMLGRSDTLDDDVFSIGLTRGGDTVYGRQDPMGQVSIYALHQEDKLRRTFNPIVPIRRILR